MVQKVKKYLLRKKITKQYLILLMCSWMSISYMYHTQSIEKNNYMLKINDIAKDREIITQNIVNSDIVVLNKNIFNDYSNFEMKECLHNDKKIIFHFSNKEKKNEFKFAIAFFIKEFNAMYNCKKGGDGNVSKYL